MQAPGQVSIPSGAVALEGLLDVPASPRGIVIFSHGSGSGRRSPRNRYVAGQLVQAGERLAVIEAMKMENILTATQDVKVAEVLAKVGESLAVDQPIVRFE